MLTIFEEGVILLLPRILLAVVHVNLMIRVGRIFLRRRYGSGRPLQTPWVEIICDPYVQFSKMLDNARRRGSMV